MTEYGSEKLVLEAPAGSAPQNGGCRRSPRCTGGRAAAAAADRGRPTGRRRGPLRRDLALAGHADPRPNLKGDAQWERFTPFATLITIATTYLEPENYDLDGLIALGKRDDLDKVRVFKYELRQVLWDPAQLPT
jgi:hypothetical protein